MDAKMALTCIIFQSWLEVTLHSIAQCTKLWAIGEATNAAEDMLVRDRLSLAIVSCGGSQPATQPEFATIRSSTRTSPNHLHIGAIMYNK